LVADGIKVGVFVAVGSTVGVADNADVGVCARVGEAAVVAEADGPPLPLERVVVRVGDAEKKGVSVIVGVGVGVQVGSPGSCVGMGVALGVEASTAIVAATTV
jgi:hypothetical protein